MTLYTSTWINTYRYNIYNIVIIYILVKGTRYIPDISNNKTLSHRVPSVWYTGTCRPRRITFTVEMFDKYMFSVSSIIDCVCPYFRPLTCTEARGTAIRWISASGCTGTRSRLGVYVFWQILCRSTVTCICLSFSPYCTCRCHQ